MDDFAKKDASENNENNKIGNMPVFRGSDTSSSHNIIQTVRDDINKVINKMTENLVPRPEILGKKILVKKKDLLSL